MTLDCTLNSISLAALDERIQLLDLKEDAPELRISTLAPTSGGRHLMERVRESLTVTVTFAIHEPDPAARRSVLRSVNAWADAGGLLTVSDRPGQHLRVICTALPAMNAKDWTASLHLSFTTTLVPYWEDAKITQVSSTGTMTLNTPGTAPSAPVTVLVINQDAQPLTSLTLYCGGTQMTFEGLMLETGGTFLLDQSAGRLLVLSDGQSALNCRTPQSDDRLLAPCGKRCTAYASCNRQVSTTFSVRGRYL